MYRIFYWSFLSKIQDIRIEVEKFIKFRKRYILASSHVQWQSDGVSNRNSITITVLIAVLIGFHPDRLTESRVFRAFGIRKLGGIRGFIGATITNWGCRLTRIHWLPYVFDSYVTIPVCSVRSCKSNLSEDGRGLIRLSHNRD